MNGGTRNFAMMTPETAPQSVAEDERSDDAEAHRQAPIGQEHAALTAQNVISVPTERSMPPVMMTKVAGDAQDAVDRGRLQDADYVGFRSGNSAATTPK